MVLGGGSLAISTFCCFVLGDAEQAVITQSNRMQDPHRTGRRVEYEVLKRDTNHPWRHDGRAQLFAGIDIGDSNGLPHFAMRLRHANSLD